MDLPKDTIRIPATTLLKIYTRFAEYHGAEEDEALIFANCLLRADLRGHTTQGIGLLPYINELFDNKVMHFGRQFEVLRETQASALIDGHRGVGQVVGTRAMRLAMDKARDVGIGFVAVRGSSDYGMASNYTIQAQEEGLIGISMSTGPLLVAPWGGRDAWFCTNPLSIAVPAGVQDPIVIDMATSANSMGNVVRAARDGCKLAGKEVVDAGGHYTDDPARVILDIMDRESRMSGALLPSGPKGFGMLLLVEMLAGLLSGERRWEDETPATPDERNAFYGQAFIAISISHFQNPETFAVTADRMIATLSMSKPAAGFEQVRLHGGGAAEKERESREIGVMIRKEEWRLAARVAERLGIRCAET